MPTRQRIGWQPASASSGGGGTPTTGDLVLGPSFGQSAGYDESTFNLGANLDLATLDFSHTKTVGANIDIASFEFANTKTVGVDQTQDIGLTNTKTIGANADFLDLALENTKTVGIDMSGDLALANTKTAGTHLSGTVLGAPFWQSSNTTSGTGIISGTMSIPPPSGIQDGDLLVAFVTVSGAGGNFTSAPSGWTLQQDIAVNPFSRCYTKVASSESGNYDWGLAATATFNYVGGIHRINGVDPTTPVNVSGKNNGSAADPIANGVTTTVVNCLVLAGVAQNSATVAVTFTPPTGWDERWDLSGGIVQPVSQTSATNEFAAAGATGNQTYNSSALVASNYSCITIAIAPGPLTIAS